MDSSTTFIALDFETADRGPDSACALGMARLRNGQIEDTFYSLIRPPRKDVQFTWVHGLTWPMLAPCPTFPELWEQISSFLEGADYLAAHNAAFDRGVLYACCQKAGLPQPEAPFVCTLKGSRNYLRLPSHSLNNVSAFLGIPLIHHHALEDATASAKILAHLLVEKKASVESLLIGMGKKTKKVKR